MIILGPLMIPVTGLFMVAPPSQLCFGAPASWRASESAIEVWSTSGHWPVTGSDVHPREPPSTARSKFDWTTCGATCGSGCQEFAISGSETGGQRPKLLVVT